MAWAKVILTAAVILAWTATCFGPCVCSMSVSSLEWCIHSGAVRVSENAQCLSSSIKNVSLFAMRGERESAQLMLALPPDGTFSMSFSSLKSAAGDTILSSALSYRQVIYVFCPNSTLEQTSEARWVADPLLPGDSDGAFPIKGGLTQAVWISVDIPRDAVAAMYTGTATWKLQTSTALISVEVPIFLKVWDITVPDLASASFTMTFSFDGLYDLYNNSETMKRRYFDLLTSYRMPPDSLYSYVNIDPSVADYMASTGSKWFNLLNFGGLVFRLQNGIPPEQDSRDHWHEGLLKQQSGLSGSTDCPIHANISDDILNKALNLLAPAVARAEKLGYLDRAFVYGFDEAPVSCLASMRRVLGAVKARWPRLHTASVLNWFTMPTDVPLDIWVFEYHLWDDPKSTIRAATEAFVAKRPDRRIFFYHCVDPASPKQLNTFIDRPLLETRLLFWDAAANSPAVSGWLYYAVNEWQYKHGSARFVTRLNDTARSDFIVSRPFGVTLANGDGFFIYPSEAGPLGSLRTEALRDAAEDIELLRLLPLATAQSLVRQVVRASNDFTLDPVLLGSLRSQAAKLVLDSR